MRKPLPSILAALVCFGVGLGVSLQYDRFQSERFLKGASVPLVIAVQTNDDLMALDWARRFESLEGVEAFKAVCGGKALASGGQAGLLAPGPGPNFEWSSPMRYRLRLIEEPLPKRRLELEVVLHASPGPLGWGVFASILGLLGLGAGLFFGQSDPSRHKTEEPVSPKPENPLSEPPSSRIPQPPTPANANRSSWKEVFASKPSIRLDSRWTIQELSEGIPALFQLSPEDLVGHHLLDLDPHPELLNLLEKCQKGSSSKGFNRFPSKRVEMTPLEGQGIILTFTEPTLPPKAP